MATVGSAIVAIIWKQPFLRSSAIVCDLRSSAIDCDYMETAFFAIVCDCLRSAIVCDRLRLYGNQPLDRTWFYLLRSSAITIAGSQTIAEVFPYDRRPYCDLRSAIIWKPAFKITVVHRNCNDFFRQRQLVFLRLIWAYLHYVNNSPTRKLHWLVARKDFESRACNLLENDREHISA